MRTLQRILAVVCLLAVLYGLWVLSAPWWAGLGLGAAAAPWTDVLPIAQIVAFPRIVALVFLVGFLAAIALRVRGRALSRAGEPRAGRPGLGALVCLVGAMASVACLILATVPAPSNRPDQEREHTMSIVSWNVHDELSEDNLKELTDGRPDVMVFPEASTGPLRDHLRDMGRDDQYQVFATSTEPGFTPTTVLVSRKLGEYRTADAATTTLGTLTVEPVDPGSRNPTILAVHTASPMPRRMNLWAGDVRSVLDEVCPRAGAAPRSRPMVAAGDFNANPWHAEMAGLPGRAGCQDGLPNSGVSSGTWPSRSPAWARTQIDHVIGNGSVTVDDGRVLPLRGGSDHLPVGATIRY